MIAGPFLAYRSRSADWRPTSWKPRVPESSTSPPKCATASYIVTVVPLPYDIDRKAYTATLDNFRGLDQLQKLIRDQSAVSSSIVLTNEDLTKRLACALKGDPGSKKDHISAKLALLNEVKLVQRQVRYTVSNVSHLHDSYAKIESDYHEYEVKARTDLQAVQLTEKTETAIRGKFYAFQLILRLDFKKKYWDPWQEKNENLTRIQRAMSVARIESARVRKILYHVQDLGKSLEDLAAILEIRTQYGQRRWRRYIDSILFGSERYLENSDSKKLSFQFLYWYYFAEFLIEDENEKSLTNCQFRSWWNGLRC